jgi:hypothetical protein
MNGELERMWNEVVVAYVKVQLRGTEEIHERL